MAGPSRKWWWKSSGRVRVSLVPAGTDFDMVSVDGVRLDEER